MPDQHGVAQERDEFVRDLGEDRFVGEELLRQAMDLKGLLRHVPFRVDVFLEGLAGRQVIDQFDGADFDDPVPGRRIESRRFGIQNDLSHGSP